MRNCARVVVEKGEFVYLLKRRKKINGSISEYYVIPGGGVELGETFEDAAKREIKEELSVDVELEDMFHEEYNEDLDKKEKFYFGRIIKGKVMIGSEGELKDQSIDNEC